MRRDIFEQGEADLRELLGGVWLKALVFQILK